MTKKVWDVIHRYEPWPGNKSQCRVRIYTHGDQNLVILEEMNGNQGMSVTNYSEELATELARKYRLDPAKTTWIEHYPKGLWYREKDTPEEWDVITYAWENGKASDPHWRRIAGEQLERWEGEEIA